MKRFLILICAVAALVCSCDKYGATLDDLGERIEAQYQTATKLLGQVEAMALLAQAKEAQMKIASVTYDETSMTVTFSDGTKYIIEQGKDSGIVATESDEYWNFAFNGESLDLLKEFLINLDAESFEVPATSSAEIPYTIQAGGETTFVTAKGYGINIVEVDQENNIIKIQAGRKTGEASILITAIRNMDCKVIEKLIPIEITPRQNPKIVFEGAAAGYYGQGYSDGTDNYYTQFWKGEIDDNGYFVGEAYSVTLDCYTPISSIIEFPAGEYVPSDDVNKEFVFLVGTEMTLREELESVLPIYEYLFGISSLEELAEALGYSLDELDDPIYESGASLEHQTADGDYEQLAITDGIVKVVLNGTTYSATMNIVADNSEWELTYEGEIPVEDHTVDGGGDDGGGGSDFDPSIVWDSVSLEPWGEYTEDTAEWCITFLSSEYPLDWITLFVLAPIENIDEIAEGTYELNDDPVPFSVEPYYSYWCSNYEYCDADSGTVTIKKNDDGSYNFILDFEDADMGPWYFDLTLTPKDIYGVKKPMRFVAGLNPSYKGLPSPDNFDSPKDYYNVYKARKAGHAARKATFVNFK